MLGLTGEADGPPIQAAGQIADIGGGALMGAIGVLVALSERGRSGEGQFVDCSMFDGSLSWLALVAAEALATGKPPRRGQLQLAGALTCYRPYRCADGYVTLGALEPKFWQAWCIGVGREDLIGHASIRRTPTRTARCPRSSPGARARSGGRSPPSTIAAWSPCSSSTRCSRRSSSRRGRWWWRSPSRGPSSPSGCWGRP